MFNFIKTIEIRTPRLIHHLLVNLKENEMENILPSADEVRKLTEQNYEAKAKLNLEKGIAEIKKAIIDEANTCGRRTTCSLSRVYPCNANEILQMLESKGFQVDFKKAESPKWEYEFTISW